MNLSIKIFLALVLSVVVGLIAGPDALPFIKWWIAPIGTMFINLIKMMIVPVVFTSLIVGMTSIGDTNKLGRIGSKPSASTSSRRQSRSSSASPSRGSSIRASA